MLQQISKSAVNASGNVEGGTCPLLTPSGIDFFEANGFLTLPILTTQTEVQHLIALYDALFRDRAGWETGDHFDFANTGEAGVQPSIPQILNPSRYEPRLRHTLFRENATLIARQLLGSSATLVYEHAMLKPAGSAGVTPWHQDEAFYPKYTNYKSITFWMPLQAVDQSNGCLEFIPGSHLAALVPHHSIDNDPRIPGLEADHANRVAAVACPLPAGGATIHHCRTLHTAGPNTSSDPRRAYCLAFGVRSRAHTVRTEHPWIKQKRTASARRAAEAQSALARSASALKQVVKALLR